MRAITIKNKMHNTEHTFRIADENFSEEDSPLGNVARVILSDSQVERADRALCGMPDCSCGGINRCGDQIARNEWVFPVN